MSKDQNQTAGPSVQGGQGTTADSRPGAPYPLREQDGKIWLTWQGKYFKKAISSLAHSNSTTIFEFRIKSGVIL